MKTTNDHVWGNEIGRLLAAHAWRLIAPESNRFPADAIREYMAQIIADQIIVGWLNGLDCASIDTLPERSLSQISSLLSDSDRAANGVFFTPDFVALMMADYIPNESEGIVLDLCAGAGALLGASIVKRPQFSVVGIERHPLLALAAVLTIIQARRHAGQSTHYNDKIYCGDGLAKWEENGVDRKMVRAIIGNPPYVGEKGNRELFETLRQRHPHIESYFSARMDLFYLFFHRAIDLLPSDGKLIFLTSEYWLSATGANRLRDDLALRCEIETLMRFGGPAIFNDAPGHHSLLTVASKSRTNGAQKKNLIDAVTMRFIDKQGSQKVEHRHVLKRKYNAIIGPNGWTPFVDEQTNRWRDSWLEGTTPLNRLLHDFQGVVSGADRVTRRHLANIDTLRSDIRVGEPIFLWHDDTAIGEPLRPLIGEIIRPILRASEIQSSKIYVSPPGRSYILYVDGPLEPINERLVTSHLSRYRPILEARREVRQGVIPWYRLHWPRRRQRLLGPKLVVPRRSSDIRFALDLSACIVSSDCTYLVAPDAVNNPIRYLVAMMLLLNNEQSRRYFQEYGKRKGKVIEFYSQPLQTFPVPAYLNSGQLVLSSKHFTGAQKVAFWQAVDATLGADE